MPAISIGSMFNVGGGEIVVILLLALLVLGPDKLPSTAKKVGRFMHEIRRMTSGFEQEIRSAMDFESSTSSPSSSAASDGDAIHRTSDGPTLDTPTTTPDAPVASEPNPTTRSNQADGSFVADLSAAPSLDADA